jgi:hypothetical protein
MVDNVLLDEKVNVNIITEQLHVKLDLLKPNLAPYHLKMAILNDDQTTKNHPKFENIHQWDTICCYFYCHAEQCCGSQLFNVD